MNIVQGQVTLKGSRTGIPGLLVQVFDAAGPAERTAAEIEGRLGHALGSTLTSDGEFVLRYDDTAFGAAPGRERPDLVLVVLGPEEPGRTWEQRLLYHSPTRWRAAPQELFTIQVDGALLRDKGIAPPELIDGVKGDPAAVAQRTAAELDRRRRLRHELKSMAQAEVAEARVDEQRMDAALLPRVLQQLTGLPTGAPALRRFVPPEGDVAAVTRQAHAEGISGVVNTAAARATYLMLTDEEHDALLGSDGEPDAAKVEARLRGAVDSPSVLRDDPVARQCRQRRLAAPFDPPPTAPPAPTPPMPPGASPFDLDGQLARLFDRLRSPESIQIAEGVRPDQASVDASVGRLSLRHGPADVPALYDFHQLQIAFDHVWEDARAAGVLEAARSVYRQTEEAGGDPAAALGAGGHRPLQALLREAAMAGRTKSRPMLSAMARRNNDDTGPDLDDGPRPPRPPVDPGDPPPRPPHRPPWADIGDLSDLPVFEWATEGYPFTLFAAGSVNFGLLVTYRQRWEPVTYQVGRLAKTLTLAPKESVSFTTRQVVKLSMSRKQVNASQRMRKDDSEDTLRDEAEIVQRAETKTNFSLSTKGGYDLGPLGEGDATSTFTRDAAASSQDTKKAFRQAVLKASQEFRDERKMEVEETQSFEGEETVKREILNPNDELCVTYLFYELQRRFRVREQLFRVTPVVLVGQHVPPPEQIDEAWVRRHDWVIKRFLLDDSYLPALNYLAAEVHGERVILADLKANLQALRDTVTALKDEIMQVRAQMAARYATLEAQIEKQAQIAAENSSEGFFERASEALFYDSDESEEATRIREEAAREAYERAVREEKDLRSRLEREVTAMQVASDTYTRAAAHHANQQAQIDRLVRHVRDYVLHYMQGIWSYEHPDQRFFRHHTLQAPRLLPRARRYTLTPVSELPVGVTPVPGKRCWRVEFTVELDDDLEQEDAKATLAELADLDQPLGFKGNYLIYPLKQRNALTDFMMTPYVDAELGLRDPDDAGNFTLDEFLRYVACLREQLGDRFAEVEPELRRQYEILLMDPLRDGEEVIVPTTSLYIEALVGSQPLMEDFKLLHRGLDVLKVQAEARGLELENLRRAVRVREGVLDDPSVEHVKHVYYEGGTPPHDGDE